MNSGRRVAFFLPSLKAGGAEKAILNLAQGIADKKCHVDLVLAEGTGRLLDNVPSTIRIVVLNNRRRKALRTIGSIHNLIRYIRAEKPDSLLTAMHANIVALWARFLTGGKLRVVISEHSTISQQMLEMPAWYRWVMTILVKIIYPRADCIIAVSKGVASDLSHVARLPIDRIQVIYNPILTPRTEALAQEPLTHPWLQTGEPPVILSVGRLTAAKDYSTLIRAFACIRRTRKVRLLILGEGEDRWELLSLVKKLHLLQDVCMPGFVGNPIHYMKKSAVFVLCSKYEGLPTVLVEALFCGSRIVSTDCPNGPREILRDGRFGTLVPVGDVEALSSAIMSSIDGEKPMHPADSWAPFKFETVTNKYMEILKL
jgi:glycosyltransferase involved in cell wall biosynthesis